MADRENEAAFAAQRDQRFGLNERRRDRLFDEDIGAGR